MNKNTLQSQALSAKSAALKLATLSSEQRNQGLLLIRDRILEASDKIIETNKKDLDLARGDGLSEGLIDRLMLNKERIEAIAGGIEKVVNLPDPLGKVIQSVERPNGLKIDKISVPIGVIAVIYEARPNVTLDSVALAIKSGNVVMLRGSASALETNRLLVDLVRQALSSSQVPLDSAQLVEQSKREEILELIRLKGYVDLVVPRGGAPLINYVVENTTISVLETRAGVCHLYIEKSAEPEMAIKIAINAKTSRPSVCNAIETILVDKDWAKKYMQDLFNALVEKGVECRGCEKTAKLSSGVKLATEEDWKTEYLDYIVSIKIVDSVEQAISHINEYGTKHSEAIISTDLEMVQKFFKEVDAAALYHNASTRFTDGEEFGFGAEIGISTQKLHARGPVGLPELTTYKYLVWGDGQVR